MTYRIMLLVELTILNAVAIIGIGALVVYLVRKYHKKSVTECRAVGISENRPQRAVFCVFKPIICTLFARSGD